MGWMPVIAAVWLTIAVLLAVLIGRGIRLADERTAEAQAAAVDPPEELRQSDFPPSGAPTIPGIPSARPTLGKPAAPRGDRPSARRTGLG